MASILSRPQCVNTLRPIQKWLTSGGDIWNAFCWMKTIFFLIQISLDCSYSTQCASSRCVAIGSWDGLATNKLQMALPELMLSKIYETNRCPLTSISWPSTLASFLFVFYFISLIYFTKLSHSASVHGRMVTDYSHWLTWSRQWPVPEASITR